MEDLDRIAYKAVQQLAGLATRQKAFATHLMEDEGDTIPGCSLSAHSEEISASLLGVTAIAKPRPIAVDRVPIALEYTFEVPFRNERLAVWSLYLDKSGSLYEDADFKVRFGDYNNTYVRNQILAALANRILLSPLFLPRG